MNCYRCGEDVPMVTDGLCLECIDREMQMWTPVFSEEQLKTMADIEALRDAKVARNKEFMSLSLEEQAARIAKAKHYRYMAAKDVPAYIKNEIDMGDDDEVKKWQRIRLKQLYPYLSKDEPMPTQMAGCIVQVGRQLIYGALVYEIELQESGDIKGKAWDNGILYDVTHIAERRWEGTLCPE